MNEDFMKPAEVGFQNLGATCWMSSLVQAIYACKPLLDRILHNHCQHPVVIELQMALTLLKDRKRIISSEDGVDLGEGNIISEVDGFYNEVCKLTRTSRGDTGVLTTFLTQLYGIFNRCGAGEYFFCYYDGRLPYVDVDTTGSANKKSIILKNYIEENQSTILDNSSRDIPFIIFCCPNYKTTHIERIIKIGDHYFKICAIIFGTGGHFYTITDYGRYDDGTVDYGREPMDKFIETGYDDSKNRKTNGCRKIL